jgi:hypothetical protein
MVCAGWTSGLVAVGAGLGHTEGLRFLTQLEFDVFQAVNQLRVDPAFYTRHLQQKLQYLEDGTNTFWLPGAAHGVISAEGRAVYNETIAFLSTLVPAHPLGDAPVALTLAARDHAADIGSTGGRGHTGVQGASCGARIALYGQWRQRCSELIAYGETEALAVVLQWVVDDGVPDRSHRLALFEPSFTVGGIGCGHHAAWGTVCVLELAVTVVDPKPLAQCLARHEQFLASLAGPHWPAGYTQHSWCTLRCCGCALHSTDEQIPHRSLRKRSPIQDNETNSPIPGSLRFVCCWCPLPAKDGGARRLTSTLSCFTWPCFTFESGGDSGPWCSVRCCPPQHATRSRVLPTQQHLI